MKEVYIDTEEIKDFFFQRLIKLGYVPEETELEDIADITFDYLYEIGILEELDGEVP